MNLITAESLYSIKATLPICIEPCTHLIAINSRHRIIAQQLQLYTCMCRAKYYLASKKIFLPTSKTAMQLSTSKFPAPI